MEAALWIDSLTCPWDLQLLSGEGGRGDPRRWVSPELQERPLSCAAHLHSCVGFPRWAEGVTAKAAVLWTSAPSSSGKSRASKTPGSGSASLLLHIKHRAQGLGDLPGQEEEGGEVSMAGLGLWRRGRAHQSLTSWGVSGSQKGWTGLWDRVDLSLSQGCLLPSE